jgi:hypothetical protein
MRKILPAIFALVGILIFIQVLNCGGGSGDDSSGRGELDDDTSEDDDDTSSGDDDNDDTPESVPPVLSNVYFDPNPVEIVDGTAEIHLNIDVCDANNDLMPDGRLTLSSAIGTTEFPWDDSRLLPGGDLHDVGDCDNPVSIGYVDELPAIGGISLCIEAWATDNDGNKSETLKDICVDFVKPKD